ncbi:hypothetical protein OS493_032978 [Desmophyllum pertusum]|uniref:Uncharacterized protein n=1 Tax=Desmophyllum pertusum TaxID=174260 RepID=A0A9W9Y883_9CNID|nr:hypothetical protein OS493_032978 [Desmophyllum pertusum]
MSRRESFTGNVRIVRSVFLTWLYSTPPIPAEVWSSQIAGLRGAKCCGAQRGGLIITNICELIQAKTYTMGTGFDLAMSPERRRNYSTRQ